MKRWITIILIVVGAAAVVALNLALFSGQLIGLPAEVKAALKTDAEVIVSEDKKNGWVSFQPAYLKEAKAGIIFYPEGHMDPRTYAPIGREITEAGYLVVFASRRTETEIDQLAENQRIEAVMAAYPTVSSWVLGAHTWGVNVAAGYANQHSETFEALVFWAPRLESSFSLANNSLPTLAIYGTLDEENTGFLEEVKPLLPPHTVWAVIEGGNRVSFASFGPMAADVGSSITESEQQHQAAEITIDFLNTLQK